MKKILNITSALALIASPILLANPAFAQEGDVASPTAENSAYQNMASALASDESMEQGFRILIDQTMPDLFRKDENVVQLELMCPGTIDTMMGVIEPIMYGVQERAYLQYREDLALLFSEKLSEEDANAAAGFYSSELGRKFLSSVVSSITLESTMLAAMEKKDFSVSGADLEKETQTAAFRGIFKLEPEERAELMTTLGAAEWMPAFRAITPQMQALQLKLANADLNAAEQKRFDRLLGPALDKHLDSCGLGE